MAYTSTSPKLRQASLNNTEQDGSHGWIVVFAAFMTHLLTQGIVYSFGILMVSLEDTFGENNAEISWTISILMGTLYLSGPVASICRRRYGSRVVALTGAVLAASGCFIAVFATSLFFMYLSLGFVTGVGYGLIYIPAVVEVTVIFKKNRALACGTAASGAGAAGFILSPIIELLIDTYAWRGTLLICSGLLLNCVPCSLIFRNKCATVDITEETNVEIIMSNVDRDVTTEFRYSGNNGIQTSGVTSKLKGATADKIHEREIFEGANNTIDIGLHTETMLHDNIMSASVTESMLEKTDEASIAQKIDIDHKILKTGHSHVKCGIPQLSLLQILRHKRMMLFYSSQTLFLLGFFLPLIGIPGISLQHGIEERKAVWIISAIGISTVFGRIALGYLSDRSFMNSFLLYKTAFLVAGVSTTLVPILTQFTTLILYGIVYGLSTAVMLSQTSVVLIEIIGMESMPDAMGLNNMFSGVGALLGPPALGLLYDQTGSYIYPFIASGLSMAVGGVLLFIMTFCS